MTHDVRAGSRASETGLPAEVPSTGGGAAVRARLGFGHAPPLSRLRRPLRQSELSLLTSAEKHSPVRECRRRSGNSVLETPSGLGLSGQASRASSAHF